MGTDLGRSTMTRRQVLRVGLSLAALPLFAACAPQAAPAPTAARPSRPSGEAGRAGRDHGPAAAAPAKPAEAAKPAQAAPAAPGAAAGALLKMLLWQAPTILNPHLAVGTKDNIAARCCTEPLISSDVEGKLTPVLAAEIPSAQNGGLSPDAKSVTYKLKQGIKWADGQPFSAEDVAFTFEFISNKESSATSAGHVRQH